MKWILAIIIGYLLYTEAKKRGVFETKNTENSNATYTQEWYKEAAESVTVSPDEAIETIGQLKTPEDVQKLIVEFGTIEGKNLVEYLKSKDLFGKASDYLSEKGLSF